MADLKQTQFKLSEEDKELLQRLTGFFKLENSSDTVRKLIRDTASELNIKLTQQLEWYCTATSNCEAAPTTVFTLLSKSLVASSLKVRYQGEWHHLIGWIEPSPGKGQTHPIMGQIIETAEGKEAILMVGARMGGLRFLSGKYDEAEDMFFSLGGLPEGEGFPWLIFSNLEDLPGNFVAALQEQRF